VEDDIERLVHLDEGELTILPGEGIGGVGCRLSILFPFEGGILCTTHEEVLVDAIQMEQKLLDRHRGDICKPGMLFLEVGQHGGKIVIGELLFVLGIGSLAGRKSPIVDKAATSERLRKDTLLFVSRVEPILVCPLCFFYCFAPFTNVGISYHTCQYTNIHARGKENEHSFMQEDIPLCPSHQKRNASSIPLALARGIEDAV